MSQRSRRYTSSRSGVSQRRKAVATGDYSDDDKTAVSLGKNWFFQQSPMSQVYYIKVVIGLALGILIGPLYGFGSLGHLIAGNWFIFPIIGVGAVVAITRFVLKISKDDLDDLRLIAWSGTISLFIGFVAASALMFNVVFPQLV